MASNGLKRLWFMDDGSDPTVDTNWSKSATFTDIKRDSELTTENIENELTNIKSQSGDRFAPVFHIFDMTGYATLKTAAKNKSRWPFLLEMQDGSVYRTSQPVTFSARLQLNASRFEGDAFWVLSFELGDDESLIPENWDLS